ncbi:MAG: hypothetical protein WC341_10850 [Bacteroidales bacterium]
MKRAIEPPSQARVFPIRTTIDNLHQPSLVRVCNADACTPSQARVFPTHTTIDNLYQLLLYCLSLSVKLILLFY